MIQIKKILFPADFSRCANQAFSHAIYLAKKHRAELHIMHVITSFEAYPYISPNEFPNREEIDEILNRNASMLINKLVDKDITGLKNIKRTIKRGISEAPVILDYLKDNDIDLIVMGTHGRRGLNSLFLGSTTEEVVRLSHCPVITIRELKEPITIESPKRILVPIDFSDHSLKALEYAKEIAEIFDSRLQLLHVIEETFHPAFSLSGKSSVFDLIPDIEEKTRNKMKQIAKEAKGPKVDYNIYINGGRVASNIIRFAENKSSNLIIISTHGLTGIEHLVMGSVTEKVIRFANCPVFTIKSFGKHLVLS